MPIVSNRLLYALRFSDEYFKLIAATTASESTVLARQKSGEEFLIVLRKQVYLIK